MTKEQHDPIKEAVRTHEDLSKVIALVFGRYLLLPNGTIIDLADSSFTSREDAIVRLISPAALQSDLYQQWLIWLSDARQREGDLNLTQLFVNFIVTYKFFIEKESDFVQNFIVWRLLVIASKMIQEQVPENIESRTTVLHTTIDLPTSPLDYAVSPQKTIKNGKTSVRARVLAEIHDAKVGD